MASNLGIYAMEFPKNSVLSLLLLNIYNLGPARTLQSVCLPLPLLPPLFSNHLPSLYPPHPIGQPNPISFAHLFSISLPLPFSLNLSPHPPSPICLIGQPTLHLVCPPPFLHQWAPPTVAALPVSPPPPHTSLQGHIFSLGGSLGSREQKGCAVFRRTDSQVRSVIGSVFTAKQGWAQTG